MNNKNHSLPGSQAMLAFTLSLPLSSIAEVATLDDMLVTASRSPILASQSGGSYTIITSEEIERSQQPFVLDLLRNVPGLAISQSGGIGAQTQIRIRGAESDQTLVLIDGIEANDPAQGSTYDFAHLLASEIERIEIMRGPQSSIWGSDAMGGVINIITKSAHTNQMNASLEAGSFGTLGAGVDWQHAGDQYGLRINGNFLRSDGINVSEQGDEDDGYRNNTLNLKANINPLKNLDLLFTARKTQSEKQFDPAFAAPFDGDRESDVDQTYTQFKATLDTFDGQWQHIFNAAWTITDNENFADGMQSSTSDGRKRKLSYQSNIFFDTPAFADARHTLILAFEHEKEEFKQTGTPSFFGDPNQEQDQINRGVVGEYRLSLLQQLHTSVSVRHDENDHFDNATTWRGSLSWVIPNTGTTLRAAYGTAVKNPSFTERFGFTPDSFIGNPELKPEKSKGWEIGLDQQFWQDRLSASITFFRERLEDEINGFVQCPRPSCPFINPTDFIYTAENISGRSERQGTEFSLTANLIDKLILNGMITYIDSTQSNNSGDQIREIRRPEWTAALNAAYRFYHDKALLNLNVNYVGEQNDSDFSTFPATTVVLDDYTLVNLAAEYAVLPNVTLFGRIDNLLDDDYRDVFGYNTAGIAGYAGFRVQLY